MSQPVLGLDIGGTNTKFALVSKSGEVLGVHKFHTNAQEPFEKFLQNLNQNLEPVLAEHNIKKEDLEVGVGCPNYSSVMNKLVHPPNLSWDDEPMFEKFNQLFKRVVIENDANAAAIGEHRWGKGQGYGNFAAITVGTGIGSGIFIGGELLRGHHGLAGEAGHVVVESNGRKCGCGGLGHFESYCSVTGIKATYKEITGEDKTYREIVPLYQAGDLDTLTVFELTADYFAIGISQLVTLLGVRKIILIGGGMVVGEPFVETIKTKIGQYIFPNLKDSFEIVLSDLALEYGAVLGAAALVIEE